MATGRVTDAERQRIRDLHAQGLGRNAIAREIGRGTRTISLICADLGLPFDRTATAVATEARMIDTRARRAALIERYYAQAEKILARLERDEHHITEVSIGKVVKYTAPDLPTQDVRNLVQASGAAAAQAAKLEALNTDNGVADAKSMLGQLAAGLTAAYQAMDTEGAGDAP
ncbi:helix-turn-helix domain-containing protein [Streptomyces bambusae]|uniref:helix-turn-helix domain-containing protein n=1 Tax=Streptomyces bambusae TaxID=1550616 RepID=UPI001CFE63B7|nr:helix-turn-helix domain-containing protein [Streptomyces bambusae]MCB5168010.1 helix-turn-helix domain-containing protein [Streptomyces bambusae]